MARRRYRRPTVKLFRVVNRAAARATGTVLFKRHWENWNLTGANKWLCVIHLCVNWLTCNFHLTSTRIKCCWLFSVKILEKYRKRVDSSTINTFSFISIGRERTNNECAKFVNFTKGLLKVTKVNMVMQQFAKVFERASTEGTFIKHSATKK